MEAKYEPYRSGYLDVSDGHSLYYELYGNPKGKPIVFIHGGPGYHFNDDDKRFFDPKIWNVLLFDQRGCGKSKPLGSLEGNTTPKLVEDTNALLDFVGFDKVTLFGGSWGSTLALFYAIGNAERINGIILRGIFLGDKDSKIHYGKNSAVKEFFPEYWERYMALVPKENQNDTLGYYIEKMTNGTSEEKDLYAFEYALYEEITIKMEVSEEESIKEIKSSSYYFTSLIEALYIQNTSYMSESYILDNASKLSNIPTTIIQGRYDFVCEPVSAWELHKRIKGSNIKFVTAGHSSSEKEIEKELVIAVKEFVKIK